MNPFCFIQFLLFLLLHFFIFAIMFVTEVAKCVRNDKLFIIIIILYFILLFLPLLCLLHATAQTHTHIFLFIYFQAFMACVTLYALNERKAYRCVAR